MLCAITTVVCQRIRTSLVTSVSRCLSNAIDRSKVPALVEKDLEEMFVRGSGPGGQAVAKTNNCVVLKHRPTGIVVKSHKTRSIFINRKHARDLMIAALDRKLNGDMCVAEQEKRFHSRFAEQTKRERAEKRQKKAAWKKSFENDNDNKDL